MLKIRYEGLEKIKNEYLNLKKSIEGGIEDLSNPDYKDFREALIDELKYDAEKLKKLRVKVQVIESVIDFEHPESNNQEDKNNYCDIYDIKELNSLLAQNNIMGYF